MSSRPADERLLHLLAAGTADTIGQAFFRSLVRHLAAAFGASSAFVAELVPSDPGQAEVLASLHAELAEGARFAVAESPWDLVVPLVGDEGERVGVIGLVAPDPPVLTEAGATAMRVFAARAGAEIERRRHDALLRAREAELEASRARVVEATDAERSRIGRNLHDGAQQQLVVVGQLVDLARRALERSPAEAQTLLEQAREQVIAANAELRELARGLHPVRLAEAGLTGALESLAAASPLPVRITDLPEQRLPDVIEASLYFLVSEAVTNAGKYAEATEVMVAIRRIGNVVTCEVNDDGVGGASPAGGSGLHGLAQRLEALGGRLVIVSPPGEGTRLHATLPVGDGRTAREPFMLFGHVGDGGAGERAIAAILEGRKRVTVSVAREWDLEGGLPRIGQQLPLIDQDGRRRGCVEVERVNLLPFSEVGMDVVAADGTDRQMTVEGWRDDLRSFYDGARENLARLLGEPGWRLMGDEPLAVLWFRLVDGLGS